MDWSNERYVRLYTRDSPDLMAIGWEGRLVLYELLRKVDRSGLIEADEETLPELLRVPREVFEAGWPRILKRKIVARGPSHFVTTNFVAAQEARQSDRQRQQESRLRRRDVARLESLSVTDRDGDVTKRDASVTDGHTVSQHVTPCLAVPSLDPPKAPRGGVIEQAALTLPFREGEKISPEPTPRRARKRKAGDWTAEEREVAARVITALAEASGFGYEPAAAGNVRRVAALLRSGRTEEDLLAVVRDRARRWRDDERMVEYLRPATVFGPQKFPDYLAQAKAAAGGAGDRELEELRRSQRAEVPPDFGEWEACR